MGLVDPSENSSFILSEVGVTGGFWLRLGFSESCWEVGLGRWKADTTKKPPEVDQGRDARAHSSWGTQV